MVDTICAPNDRQAGGIVPTHAACHTCCLRCCLRWPRRRRRCCCHTTNYLLARATSAVCWSYSHIWCTLWGWQRKWGQGKAGGGSCVCVSAGGGGGGPHVGWDRAQKTTMERAQISRGGGVGAGANGRGWVRGWVGGWGGQVRKRGKTSLPPALPRPVAELEVGAGCKKSSGRGVAGQGTGGGVRPARHDLASPGRRAYRGSSQGRVPPTHPPPVPWKPCATHPPTHWKHACLLLEEGSANTARCAAPHDALCPDTIPGFSRT